LRIIALALVSARETEIPAKRSGCESLQHAYNSDGNKRIGYFEADFESAFAEVGMAPSDFDRACDSDVVLAHSDLVQRISNVSVAPKYDWRVARYRADDNGTAPVAPASAPLSESSEDRNSRRVWDVIAIGKAGDPGSV
jgi:hypothetical protein